MSETETPQDTAPVIELLSFHVAGQEYSVNIMSVREIRSNTSVTPLPHAPRHVLGVINLRGTVLPIIDLGERLRQESCKSHDRAVIIVVAHADQVFGLLVEAVSDILEISENDMQPPPDMGNDPGSVMVKSLTIVEDKMIRILDLAAVLETGMTAAA